jgi:hypothetical protein
VELALAKLLGLAILDAGTGQPMTWIRTANVGRQCAPYALENALNAGKTLEIMGNSGNSSTP